MAKPTVSQSLTIAESQLESRFRRLAQILNDELDFKDQRLSFSMTPDRRGSVNWRLVSRGQTQPVAGVPRIAEALAEADDGTKMHFGLTEQWRHKQKDRFEFKGCNLIFAISNGGEGAPLLFRLEWVGRELSPEGKLVFPGKGAGHPHWQFDSELRIGREDAGGEEENETPLLEAVEDLTASITMLDEARPQTDDVISWFHKLHLPAKAMWSAIECFMPDQAEAQQHEPENAEELDRWIISALRYLRHEFEIYAY